MFTGLVEAIGTVEKIDRLEDAQRMTFHAPGILHDQKLGDSICVNGVCLTATDFPTPEAFSADVMAESLKRSALGQLREGDAVNLERAMALGQRLGGHIMQGHVDATAKLIARTHTDNWDVLRFGIDQDLRRFIVDKGSIALNGTSLTVSAVGEDWVEVSLIPTTLAKTTHGRLAIGELVNVEVDVLAKYVENMVGRPGSKLFKPAD